MPGNMIIDSYPYDFAQAQAYADDHHNLIN